MTKQFESRYDIGEEVLALGLPARVRTVTFSEQGVQCTVDFKAGGAPSALWQSDLLPLPGA